MENGNKSSSKKKINQSKKKINTKDKQQHIHQ